MDRFKYFAYQSIFFCSVLLINVIFNKYVSKPFTQTDIIAICSSIPLFLAIIAVIPMIYNKTAIGLKSKFWLSVPAFILAIILMELDFCGFLLFILSLYASNSRTSHIFFRFIYCANFQGELLYNEYINNIELRKSLWTALNILFINLSFFVQF